MNFAPYRDHIVIEVDVDAAHRTASGLYMPDWQRGDRDPIEGIVIASPQGLSQAGLSYPDMDGNRYTFSDLVDIPQPGETVYLKYNSLKEEMENPDEPGVFIVSLERVVAVKGQDGLRPFQGYLLGEEVWGDDVRHYPDGRKERVALRAEDLYYGPPGRRGFAPAASEYVTEIDPLPIPFTFRVTHTGNPLRGQTEIVATGDVVVAHRMLYAYHPVKQKDDEEASARWVNQPPKVVIDGKEYCFIPRQCVMGKRSDMTTVFDKQSGLVASTPSGQSDRINRYFNG